MDLVITDPPYYDAIPYSDLMDFFYVWMRRVCLGDSTSGINGVLLNTELAPKWSHEAHDGELIDDPSRHDERRREVASCDYRTRNGSGVREVASRR